MTFARKSRGFTLIEVALAIVIGVVLITGAVLIYNQAKNAAGNSRAQAKVASLQALVEDFLAQSNGDTPEVATLRALWRRKRPDDYNKSPWGGQLSPLEQNGTATEGVIDGNDAQVDGSRLASHILSASSGGKGGTIREPGWTGVLLYYRFYPDASDYFIWDETRQQVVRVKYYAVATSNALGERWFYVMSGKSSGTSSSDGAFDVKGQISN